LSIESRKDIIARYTEPAAMSMRIAATRSASLALMREDRSVFAGIGFAIATMLLLILAELYARCPRWRPA
jgi:hypothetical protein